MKRNDGQGFTLIELLIVVAIIAILAAIAVPNFLEAQTRSKISRLRSDQRTLATMIDAYYVDTNSFPAQSSSYHAPGANQIPGASMGLLLLPTFRIKLNAGDPLATLTTPVAYISAYPPVPFSDTKGATQSYSVFSLGNVNNPPSQWIIWSFGPGSNEASGGCIPVTYSSRGDSEYRGSGSTYTPPIIVETGYYGFPSSRLVLATYDPSNGTTSGGDLWRSSMGGGQ